MKTIRCILCGLFSLFFLSVVAQNDLAAHRFSQHKNPFTLQASDANSKAPLSASATNDLEIRLVAVDSVYEDLYTHFKFYARNNGTTSRSGIVVKIVKAAQYEFVTCSKPFMSNRDTITVQYMPTLAPGATDSTTFVLMANTRWAYIYPGQVLPVKASIEPLTGDEVPTNNVQQLNPVVQQAIIDMRGTLTGQDTLKMDSVGRYTIHISSNSTIPRDTVMVQLKKTANLSLVASNTGGSYLYSKDSTTVNWLFHSFTGTDSIVLFIKPLRYPTLPANQSSFLKASVLPLTNDNDTTNNTSSIYPYIKSTLVNDSIPNLMVDLQAYDSLYINQRSRYTIYATNTGNTTVYDAQVTLNLFSNLEFVSASREPQVNNGTLQNWTIPALTPGATDRIDVVLRAHNYPAYQGQRLTVQAYLHPQPTETDTLYNKKEVYPAIKATYYDLKSTIIPIDSVRLDQNIRYTIYITSAGSVERSNVTLQLKKSPNFQLVYSSDPVASNQSDMITWNFSTLNSRYVDVTLKAVNNPALALGDPLFLKSTITPYAWDVDTTNNSHTVWQTVQGIDSSVNLNTSLFAYDSVVINGNTRYMIFVGNYSNISKSNVTLRLKKSPNFSFVSANKTAQQITADSVVWILPNMRAYSSDTIQVQFKPLNTPTVVVGQKLFLEATVLPFDQDVDTTNNRRALYPAVKEVSIEPDNTNTTLTPPMGLQWVRFMNGNGSDYARSVAALPNGGFVIAGNTFSKSGDFSMAVDSFGNAFVARFDKDGVKQWSKVFRGTGNDLFHSIKYLEDGSFLVAGESASTDGDFTENTASQNISVLKLNADGSIRWKKFIGAGGTDNFYNMHPTQDKGVLVTHSIYTTAMGNQNYLTKLDSSGVVQWSRTVDSTMQRFDAAPAPGNKYIAAGLHTVSTFGDAYRIFKLNNNGGTEWQKTFRLSETAPTYFYFVNRVHVAQDSSIYLLGDIQYLAGDSLSGTGIGIHKDVDFALVKLDKNGNKLWQRFYGGNMKDMPFSFTPTEDGGFLITGYTYSRDGNVTASKGLQDGWLIQVDAEGKLLWQRTIGGNRTDELFDVTVTKDNSIVAVGYTSSYNSGDIYKKNGDIDVLIAKIGSSNNIQGTVYFDANSNSVKDADERYLNNIMVRSMKGENERMDITKNGFFSISVDTGMYRTQPIISENYKVNPLADTIRFTTYNTIDTVHFAVQPKEIKKDLQISLLPLTPVRPGFEAAYKLAFRNGGTITMSLDTVVLVKDRRQTFVHATPAYSFIKNDTITWIINKLEPLDTAAAIHVTLRNAVPPSLNNGDRIELVATIAPTADDATPLNNIAKLAQTVQGSYDPNDKTELHNGRITQRQLDDKEHLTYLIRFQNTGTDTAFRVIIRDTLENKLDWTTFEMLEASHPYSLSITDKNKLEWTFNNINLPDSNVNEKRSHGYISYRLKPIDGLKVGDSIINTASIYFDFNLPVVTNRSNTTVSVETVTSVSEPDPIEKNIQLFPNPTKDVLWININERIYDKVDLAIYDLSGKKLWQKQYGKITADQFTGQLNFKHYSKGVYMVTVTIGAKSYSYKVVVE